MIIQPFFLRVCLLFSCCLLSRLVYSSSIQMLNAIPCVYQQDTYIRSNNVLKLTSYVITNEAVIFLICEIEKNCFFSVLYCHQHTIINIHVHYYCVCIAC